MGAKVSETCGKHVVSELDGSAKSFRPRDDVLEAPSHLDLLVKEARCPFDKLVVAEETLVATLTFFEGRYPPEVARAYCWTSCPANTISSLVLQKRPNVPRNFSKKPMRR